VPMNRAVRAALIEAQAAALSDHVIEWAGKPVASVKRGLKRSAKLAGIVGSVSPTSYVTRRLCTWPKPESRWRRSRNSSGTMMSRSRAESMRGSRRPTFGGPLPCWNMTI
jgi:hypothetical protein